VALLIPGTLPLYRAAGGWPDRKRVIHLPLFRKIRKSRRVHHRSADRAIRHAGAPGGPADLAVATWSTTWNYGPGWEIPLLDAYGVDPDPDRTRYYRLLWEVGP
jgi:hypothetical protein